MSKAWLALDSTPLREMEHVFEQNAYQRLPLSLAMISAAISAFRNSFCPISLQADEVTGKVNSNGQVREESIRKSRENNARTKEGDPEERTVRQESEEPQTGDRDRTGAGSTRRRQGAAQAIFVKTKIVNPEGTKDRKTAIASFACPVVLSADWVSTDDSRDRQLVWHAN